MPHQPLPDRLHNKRVIVCAGPGGVGKTTTSAALALGLARRGRRVAVLTIDPAKRLAGALGLHELGGEPHRVDSAMFAAHGVELAPGGELWALTLDVKGTFDALIARLAPDAKTRDEVLANRIYQELSSAIAGSQEFTAVAKLYELERSGEFDAIVLDTPPSRNALDFLEAPGRLTQFFEGRALKVFLAPTGLAARLLGRGTGVVLSMFTRVTGVDLMGDMNVFFRSLGSITEGFTERARGIQALLRDPACSFLIVTSPEPERAHEAAFLARRLADAGIALGGLVVNRVHLEHLHGHDAAALQALLAPELGDALARRVAGNLADFDVLARRDRDSLARLREELGDEDPLLVPYLDGDVDLLGLLEVERRLFA